MYMYHCKATHTYFYESRVYVYEEYVSYEVHKIFYVCNVIWALIICSLAEELFMRSWKVYEILFGETHLMVVRPLRNLAFFYMQKDKWVVSVFELHKYMSCYIIFFLIQHRKSYISVWKGIWNFNAGIVCWFFTLLLACLEFSFI